MSPDPELPKYVQGEVNGGAFTPVNLALYAYSVNNPVTFKDPDGRNWFKVNGGYEWHEGSSYKAACGTTYSSNYTHFAEFTKTGANEYGAATGALKVYEQNNVIAESKVFSGGNGFGPIPDGTYTARLDNRGEANSLTDVKADPSGALLLKPFYGYQQIADGDSFEGNLDFQHEWGASRVRLEPDKGQSGRSGQAFFGNYIHGKKRLGEPTDAYVTANQYRGRQWMGPHSRPLGA